MHWYLFVHMFVHARDCQSLTSGFIPQELSTLIFEEESLIKSWDSLIDVGYTAIVFWESAYFIFPVTGSQASSTTSAF